MGLIDYFRIFKALIILFLLIFLINYVPNQNGKVPEERPSGFNSDTVKTTLRGLYCFKMAFPLLHVPQKSLPIPVSLSHIQQRV